MADLARIKSNVAKMAAQGAPEEDIDGYIASEGVTIDDVRNFKLTPPTPTPQQAATKEPPKDGFVQNLKSDVKNRLGQISEIESAQKSGQQGAVESGFQKAGVAAGLTADVVGNAVGSTAKAGYQALPMSVQDPINKVGKELLQTPIVQGTLSLAGKGAEAVRELKTKNPRLYRNLGAGINLGAVISPKPSLPKSSPSVTAKLGKAIEGVADKQITKSKEKFAKKLISPIDSKAVREAQVKNSSVNMLGTVTPNASKFDNEVAKEVAKVEGVKAGQIFQKNYNAISEAVSKEAEVLQKTLDANDVPLTPQDFQLAAKNIGDRLAQDINITGDSEKIAKKVLSKYSEIIMSRPRTAANLLRARKDLDSWIKIKMEDTVFDPVRENAISSAVKAIRQESNDLISSKFSNVDVKNSLSRQHKLLSAMENIAPKAAEQAKTKIGRAAQAVGKVTESKGKVAQAAAIGVGAGGALLLTKSVPVLAGLGLGAYMVKKGTETVLSPQGVKALGKLLQSNDTDIVRSISVNRALLLDIVNNATTEDNNFITDAQGNKYPFPNK